MKQLILVLTLALGVSGCVRAPISKVSTAPTIGFGGADAGFGGTAHPANKLGARMMLGYPACTPVGGVQCTTNYGFWLPPHGYPNWDVPLNANSQIADAAIAAAAGGKPASPAYAVQFANSSAVLFQADSTITINPSLHTLVSPNLSGSFIQSVSCINGNNSTDHDALLAAISLIETTAPNGRGTVRIPEGVHCNILPPSSTSTEALLVTGPVSLDNHGVINFQTPAPSTASATACSISSNVATITASNSFVAGWTGSIGGFASACAELNGMRFTISATGLSGSQFEFTVPRTVSNLGTSSDSATALATMPNVRIKPSVVTYGLNWNGAIFQNVTAPDTGSTTTGGDMVVFDCSGGGSLARIRMSNMLMNSSPAGFNSVFMDNTTNANGCLFESDFQNPQFYSGVYLQHMGDNNRFTGPGYIGNANGDGINAENLIGATNNIISGVTVEGSASQIHLRGGLGWVISQGEVGADQSNANSTSNIWLDGSDSYNALNGTVIENSKVVDPVFPLAVPNLQVDPTVLNTTIRNDFWTPQIVSGVPSCAIKNNGAILNVEGTQLFPAFNNYSLYCGAGAWGPSPPNTANGAGKPIENDGLNSEDPTQWAVACDGGTCPSGGGSTVTFGSPVQITDPFGKTITATPVTMTLGANGTTGYTTVLSYNTAVALPNPHGIVEKMYVLPAACPTATLYTFIYFSQLQKMSCGGPFNGWSLLKASQGNIANTSASAFINLTSTAASTYSTTMTFYVTDAQLEQNDGEYVKTTNQAVPLAYGYNPARNVGPYPVTSPNGWYDSSTVARPPCGTGINFVPVGTLYTEKGTGAGGSSTLLECEVTNSTLGTYAWQEVFQETQQPENYLLQSNTWNSSPWQLLQTGTALTPVVTSAGAVADPFGSTGTVQEVVLDLNGDVTPNDYSRALQSATPLANPHTTTISFWMRAKTGTCIVVWGQTQGGVLDQVANLTTSWKFFTVTQSVPSTFDTWVVDLTAGSGTSTSCDLYVMGSGMTYHGGAAVSASGSPATTTTVPIDNTSLIPLGSGFTVGTQPITSTSATGPTQTQMVNCPTGGATGQYCGAEGAWDSPALSGTTGSIGGGALPVNACATGTATVTGISSAMAISVTPVSDPNASTTQDYDWYGYMSGTNTVTVKVCALVAGTPGATTYNVRAIQ